MEKFKKSLDPNSCICSTKIQGNVTVFAFDGDKPDTIDIVAIDHEQNVLCTGKLYHDNKVIDSFSGNISKKLIIIPIIKELIKNGYSSDFE